MRKYKEPFRAPILHLQKFNGFFVGPNTSRIKSWTNMDIISMNATHPGADTNGSIPATNIVVTAITPNVNGYLR